MRRISSSLRPVRCSYGWCPPPKPSALAQHVLKTGASIVQRLHREAVGGKACGLQVQRMARAGVGVHRRITMTIIAVQPGHTSGETPDAGTALVRYGGRGGNNMQRIMRDALGALSVAVLLVTAPGLVPWMVRGQPAPPVPTSSLTNVRAIGVST